LKPKDLCLIPFRLALALQEAGWWVRSTIIWHKPTAMPESVTDRPTTAHEYVFLLAKSPDYFYDAEAIKERGTMKPQQRFTNGRGGKDNGYAPHRKAPGMADCETRNARSVWTINAESYDGAHFATFPTALVKRCILAGCPVGGTVLDPFAGSGTTGQVAVSLGRSFVGVELNREYCKLAERRIRGANPPLPLFEETP
jgi:DNA modification methylase